MMHNYHKQSKIIYTLTLVHCLFILFLPYSEMKTYKTWVSFNFNKMGWMCKPKFIQGHNFSNLDEEPFQFLTTPKYSSMKYGHRILQYINFQCPDNTIGHIWSMNTDIQQRVTIGNNDICLDYLKIEYNKGNSVCPDICGNETITTMGCSTIFDDLFITFRSDATKNAGGFVMNVCCFNPGLANQAGCFKMNNQVTVEEYFQKGPSKETFPSVEQDTDYNDEFQDYLKEYYEYLSTLQVCVYATRKAYHND